MSFRSINAKLSVLIAAIAIVSLATLGYFSLTFAQDEIRRNLEQSIVSALNFHKPNIENSFRQIESKISSLASGFALVQAMHEFEEAIYLIDPEVKTALLRLRSVDADQPGPAPAQELEDSLYKQASLRYDPFLNNIVKQLGISDLMLIEPQEGFIIYSTSKGAEFGKSLLTGELNKTWLGRAVGHALTDTNVSSSLSPFAPYPGPDGLLSAFLVRPIVDARQLEGVVAIRIPATRLGSLLALGPETGLRLSLYALDHEKRVIAASGNAPKQWSGTIGPTGRFSERPGPNGESLISSTAPIEIGGSDYWLVAEADMAEAFSRLGDLKLDFMLALFPVGLVALLSLFVINRIVTRPIVAVGEAMKAIASKGSFARGRLPENSSDEIGTLSRQVNDMNQRLEALGDESASQTRSFDKYAESLVSKTDRLLGEAQKRDKLLQKSDARIKELLEIVERQRIELAAQNRRLDAGRTYLKKIDEANERFLIAVESGLKERLNLLLKRAEAVFADSANSQAGAFVDEIRIIDELVGKAVSGFAFEPDAGPVEFRPVNLSEIGKEAVNSAADLAAKRKLRLTFTHDARSHLILADKQQIRVAMDCLIENGLKYTPEKGSVHVSIKDTDKVVRFEVADTGVGVEKENIEKIFQKFYRIENESGGSDSGMGLGLYICRMIVRRHDGKIGAESEPGQGSVFFFELNRKSASGQNSVSGLR